MASSSKTLVFQRAKVKYSSSIGHSNIPVVKENCNCQDLDIIAPDLAERETGGELTLARLMNLYSPKIFRGEMVNFNKCGHHALLSSMDDDNDREWMEQSSHIVIDSSSSTYFSDSGSVVVPEEEVLANPIDAARLLQEAFTRTCISRPSSGVSPSFRCHRPENKQPKNRRSSAAGGKYKRARSVVPELSSDAMVLSTVPEPAIDIVAIDDDRESSDDRRRRPSSTQHNTQFVELSTGSLPSSVDEKPTTSTALAAATSRASTPSASSASSPTLFLPPTTVTSSPPVAVARDNNDQLLAERYQTAARLSKPEARVAEAVELEVQLQQKAKAKWVEVQNAILTASDHEAASIERLNNLEAALHSKTEEIVAAEEKHARLKERHKKVTEHNKVFCSTVRDLDVSLQATRFVRDSLSVEVDKLKEELQRRAASLIVEKTHSMYSMRRKILEEAKAGLIDFEAEIAKAQEAEGDDAEGQNIKPAADLPTSPGA
ncbi:PREDICTED: uncharacterized protein LOC109230304 [Nicotiana attenuata]|uniref:uncharacterized protein LOC109230304 n=1 Tax=Nicotiana attenuata TaxID=49451 RepID=UPI00090545C3|nr:PREDICTED: uncharacterized protein LOC109230304 [Nicotiana attenuata]